LLNKVGKLIASIYMEEKLDAVVTIATKGISLANAVANILNLPKDKYEALEKALLNIFKNREKLLNSITKPTVTKSRIKVMVDN
ncbi:hypothetical protein M8409_15485, partial [Staphylococcus aureus]|nr:hypothetical protein [Staphylococcus aureus]